MFHSFTRALAFAGLLTISVPAFAQSAPTPVSAPPVVSPLDQEVWAGITYRQALTGIVVLAGGAAVATWLTDSAIAGVTAAATVAAAYVVYDPGVTGVLSPNDLPTLRDLRVGGDKGKD